MRSTTTKFFFGALIFFSGLTFFLLYLPGVPNSKDPPVVEISQEKGNYSSKQSVNGEPSMANGRGSSADSLNEGTGREIKLNDMSALNVDDEIDLYIPQENRSYRGEVAKISVTAAGNRVLSGFFDSEMRRYRFIFTVGASQTFGTLQTGQGRYQLEVRNGLGRIVSAEQLNQNLDFSKPDYLIPKRREPMGQGTVGGGER